MSAEADCAEDREQAPPPVPDGTPIDASTTAQSQVGGSEDVSYAAGSTARRSMGS